MKRAAFVIVALLALAAPLPAQSPLQWADLWKPTIKALALVKDAEEVAVLYTHEIRVLAVDALFTPDEKTVWHVVPRSAGRVTTDDDTGLMGVFTPTATSGTCQVWSRTGKGSWRVLIVHLVTPWPMRGGITTGEAWVQGPR